MKRNLIVMLGLLVVFELLAPAFAKRGAPKQVKPVEKEGIEYSAPLDREGYIVATWIKTKREIWSRQIYVVKHEYKLGLSPDVQTCFITNLELKDGKLRIRNERKAEFELDLEKLDVKVLQGQGVIDYTAFKPPKK